MTHQVNLNSQTLLPGFGPVQLPLFIATILVSILAGGVWFYLSWSERQSLLAQEQELQIALESEIQTLAQFQAQYPNLNDEPALQAENEELTAQLLRTRETFSGLANQIENAIEGFNKPLTQLSDYDLNGLWLNKIELKDGKRFFELEGVARSPELIPQYIEQLGESTFSGISIQQLTVTKEDRQNLWRFTLSNGQATPAPSAEGESDVR